MVHRRPGVPQVVRHHLRRSSRGPSPRAWASTAPPSRGSAGSRSRTWWPSPTPPPSRSSRGSPRLRWPGCSATSATPTARRSTAIPGIVLKRQLARAAELGFTFYVGPELEYFYFRDSKGTRVPGPRRATSTSRPWTWPRDYRKRTVEYLEAMGIPVEYVHHEVAPSPARDRPALRRRPVDGRQRHDLPADGEGGRPRSSACTPRSCPSRSAASTAAGCTPTCRCSRTTATPSSTPPTSSTCRRSARRTSPGSSGTPPEITLVTNQWVNSYKRLVPGYEAPVYICWARRNRSALVRVPMYKPGKERRHPHRVPLPRPRVQPIPRVRVHAGGRAGRDRGRVRAAARGLEQHLRDERRGATRPPASSPSPRTCTRRSSSPSGPSWCERPSGDHVFEYLIRNKREEWDDYKAYVTPYELERYLPLL